MHVARFADDLDIGREPASLVDAQSGSPVEVRAMPLSNRTSDEGGGHVMKVVTTTPSMDGGDQMQPRVSKTGTTGSSTGKTSELITGFLGGLPNWGSGRARGSIDAAPSSNNLTSGHIKVVNTNTSDDVPPLKSCLSKILGSTYTDLALSLVVLLNIWLLCKEADSRAEFPEASGRSSMGAPAWLLRTIDVCYIIFLVELIARLVLERGRFIYSVWNQIDLGVVLLGLLEYILLWSDVKFTGPWGILRVTRLFRLLRLIRVLRLFSGLKELRSLLEMMSGCSRTLFWSCLMLTLVMIVWGLIAVELINPLMVKLANEGRWSDCERCKTAFSSVFMATLTIFQTVIAGDSWGLYAVPVIEEWPWTISIFGGSLITLVFGVLNLVVAVMVDTFAEARARDMHTVAEDMDFQEVAEKKILAGIFAQIDADNSGSVCFEELKEGAHRVAGFANWLRVMDVDECDLQQFFDMVDADGSGEIDPEEFTQAMYRMKNAEPRTATRFVKDLVTKLVLRQEKLTKKIETLQQLVKEQGSADCTKGARNVFVVRDRKSAEHGPQQGPIATDGPVLPRVPEAEEVNVQVPLRSVDAVPHLLALPTHERLLESLRMQEQCILESIEVAIRQAAEKTLDALAAGPEATAQTAYETGSGRAQVWHRTAATKVEVKDKQGVDVSSSRSCWSCAASQQPARKLSSQNVRGSVSRQSAFEKPAFENAMRPPPVPVPLPHRETNADDL